MQYQPLPLGHVLRMPVAVTQYGVLPRLQTELPSFRPFLRTFNLPTPMCNLQTPLQLLGLFSLHFLLTRPCTCTAAATTQAVSIMHIEISRSELVSRLRCLFPAFAACSTGN